MVITAWAGIISSIYFGICKYFNVLRISVRDELIGGDIHYFAPFEMEGVCADYVNGHEMSTEMKRLQALKGTPISNFENESDPEKYAT